MVHASQVSPYLCVAAWTALVFAVGCAVGHAWGYAKGRRDEYRFFDTKHK